MLQCCPIEPRLLWTHSAVWAISCCIYSGQRWRITQAEVMWRDAALNCKTKAERLESSTPKERLKCSSGFERADLEACFPAGCIKTRSYSKKLFIHATEPAGQLTVNIAVIDWADSWKEFTKVSFQAFVCKSYYLLLCKFSIFNQVNL